MWWSGGVEYYSQRMLSRRGSHSFARLCLATIGCKLSHFNQQAGAFTSPETFDTKMSARTKGLIWISWLFVAASSRWKEAGDLVFFLSFFFFPGAWNWGHFLRALCVCTWRKGRSRVPCRKSCVCYGKPSFWVKCQTASSASEWGETAGTSTRSQKNGLLWNLFVCMWLNAACKQNQSMDCLNILWQNVTVFTHLALP